MSRSGEGGGRPVPSDHGSELRLEREKKKKCSKITDGMSKKRRKKNAGLDA